MKGAGQTSATRLKRASTKERLAAIGRSPKQRKALQSISYDEFYSISVASDQRFVCRRIVARSPLLVRMKM
jgi:hypothetical protein